MLDLQYISAPVVAELRALDGGNAAFDLVAVEGGRFAGVSEHNLRVTGECEQPKEALAGLLLYAGFGGASHNASQGCTSREGIYWHGIYHRMEPDEWNAMYWLGKVGKHEIHAPLAKVACDLGWPMKGNWEHQRFVDFTSEARSSGRESDMKRAIEIQLAEWQLLFAWCARDAKRWGSSAR